MLTFNVTRLLRFDKLEDFGGVGPVDFNFLHYRKLDAVFHVTKLNNLFLRTRFLSSKL